MKTRGKSFRVLVLALLIGGILCLAAAFGLTAWKAFAGNDASVGIIGGADAPTFWFVFLHGLGGIPVMLCAAAMALFAAALAVWFGKGWRIQ